MKTYLGTSGILFVAMAAVHVWRAIDEWPGWIDGGFLMQMGVLIALPAALGAWAFYLLRKTH